MKIKNLRWLLFIIALPFTAVASAGTMWQWTGQIWYQLPHSPSLEATFFYPWNTVVGDNSSWLFSPRFKLDKRNGYVIWEYTGPTPVGPIQPTPTVHYDNNGSWQAIDNNSKTIKIVYGNGRLYQLHDHGRIWAFTNRQWIRIDDNYRTKDIVVASGVLYQIHNNGDIWMYNHNVCLDQRLGKDCWTRIDNNRSSSFAIQTYNGNLIQLHR